MTNRRAVEELFEDAILEKRLTPLSSAVEVIRVCSDVARAYAAQVRREEREACAFLAMHYVRDDVPEGAMLSNEFEMRGKIAAAIREQTP